MKSPIVLLLSLLTDVRRLQRGVKGLDRDIITIKNRFEKEGIGFLSIALPCLGKSIDNGLRDGKLTVPLGFSKTHRGSLPRLFSGLICKVFEEKTGLLREIVDVGALKLLRELTYLFKKVSQTDRRVEILDREAKDSFWICDDEVKCEFTPSEINMISSVSRFMLRNISDDLTESAPKHGPGSVHEGYTPNQKWVAVAKAVCEDDPRIKHLELDSLLSLFFENGEVTPDIGISQEVEQRCFNNSPVQPSRRSAKLISVPKSSTSRRTITVEPALNQFLQQQLNCHLRKSIRACTILRNCLALSDQSENQTLALEGSRTGIWATIDLSSASDLLGCKLVEIIFGHKHEFLELMYDCRSSDVIDGLTRRTIKKYAGMGNATTFPVQSIVFATLAILGVLQSKGLTPSYRNVRDASCCVRVYGDDIIVKTEHFHHVASWLSRCGLRLNASKTFSTGNFRESCGVDAYLGFNVTPLYAKTLPVVTSKELNHLADMVSLRNASRARCLYHLSDAIQGYVEKRFFPLPYVSESCGGLGWVDRMYHPSKDRWNKHLQRHEYRVPFQVGHIRKDKISGLAALIRFFLASPMERVVGLDLNNSSQRFKSKIRWRWVPSE